MTDTSDMRCPVCADRVAEANTPNPSARRAHGAGDDRWTEAVGPESFRLLAGIALSPLRRTQSRLGRGEELAVIAVRTVT